MNRFLLLGPLALFALASGCANDGGSDDPFDGNFIVGDAEPFDLGPGPSDADPGDRGPGDLPDLSLDAQDLGLPELGAQDTGDAEPPDLGPDPCAVQPEESLTASAAVARAAALAGRVLEVSGLLGTGPESCTEIACSIDNPCCNTCFAALALDAVLPVEASNCLPNVGCSGDECGLVCRPAVLGTPGVYVGRLHHDRGQGARLELIEVRR
jgi:hypothetical protein